MFIAVDDSYYPDVFKNIKTLKQWMDSSKLVASIDKESVCEMKYASKSFSFYLYYSDAVEDGCVTGEWAYKVTTIAKAR